jgi:hypothetical protein
MLRRELEELLLRCDRTVVVCAMCACRGGLLFFLLWDNNSVFPVIIGYSVSFIFVLFCFLGDICRGEDGTANCNAAYMYSFESTSRYYLHLVILL